MEMQNIPILFLLIIKILERMMSNVLTPQGRRDLISSINWIERLSQR